MTAKVPSRGPLAALMSGSCPLMVSLLSPIHFAFSEFGHPEWIDFPRVDTYDTSTGAFIPGTAS